MDDTMDVLAAKIEGKTKHLTGIAAEVAEKHEADAEVVCGHNYEVKLDMSQPAKKRGKAGIKKGSGASASASTSNDWTFVAVPVTSKVRALFDSWEASERVSGGLKEVKDVFNDNIKYELKDYDDVKRLLVDLPSVGEKWTMIARDTPANCAQVRLLLENMGVLEEALGELHQLTMDARDPMAGEKEGAVRNSLDTIAREWRRVEELVPKSEGGKLEGCVAGAAGAAALVQAFQVAKAGALLLIQGKKVTKTGNSQHQQSSFMLDPPLAKGKHTVKFRVDNLGRGGHHWICFGTCAPSADISGESYTEISGISTSGQLYGQHTGGYGREISSGTEITVAVDCDARTQTISWNGESSSASGIAVPCAFAFNLYENGNTVTFL